VHHGTADLHIHTTCSDGFSTPERLAKHLLGLGLDVVAVTDHDTLEGSLRLRDALAGEGPEVIVGEEVSSGQGHVLALFVERQVRSGMSAAATVDAIHEQGGLAIAAHPFMLPWAPGRPFFVGVGELAWELPFDAIEVVNGAPGLTLANRRARRRNGVATRPSLGGSDSHVMRSVGQVHTVFPGTTGANLRRAIEKGTTRPGVRIVGQLRSHPAHLSWLIGRHALRKVAGPDFMTPRLVWESSHPERSGQLG
jgi:predicted metal-dependent phosphoesterase TrpH